MSETVGHHQVGTVSVLGSIRRTTTTAWGLKTLRGKQKRFFAALRDWLTALVTYFS